MGRRQMDCTEINNMLPIATAAAAAAGREGCVSICEACSV